MITLLALALAGPAHALDLNSLRAESTYGLYREAYDFFQLPGRLATEEERGVMSLLAHEGDAGHFSSGYYGGMGKGVFGVMVDYARAGTSSAAVTKDDVDGDTTTARANSAVDASHLDMVLAYGLNTSDSFSIGAALRFNNYKEESTIDPLAPSPGSSTSSLDAPDDAGDAKAAGTYTGGARIIEAQVGIGLHGDSHEIAINAVVGQLAQVNDVNGKAQTDDQTDTVRGYLPGSAWTGNRTGLAPGLRFDGIFDINDDMALRINAGVGTVKGGPTTPKTTFESDPDGGDTTTISESLKGAEFSSLSWTLLGALHIDAGDYTVRPGLRLAGTNSSQSYKLVNTTEVDGSDPVESEASYGGEAKGFLLGLPIAAEVPLGESEAWRLRLGAEWDYYKATGVSLYNVTDEEQETSHDENQTDVVSGSVVTGALGVGFQPVEGLRLDGVIKSGSAWEAAPGAFGAGSGASKDHNLATVAVSATFIIP
jgi:hypothetical protein